MLLLDLYIRLVYTSDLITPLRLAFFVSFIRALIERRKKFSFLPFYFIEKFWLANVLANPKVKLYIVLIVRLLNSFWVRCVAENVPWRESNSWSQFRHFFYLLVTFFLSWNVLHFISFREKKCLSGLLAQLPYRRTWTKHLGVRVVEVKRQFFT